MSLELRFPIAHFKSYSEAHSDQRCMICLNEGPLRFVSHVASTAEKVHHVACLDCLKVWSQKCEDQYINPHCPLCRDVLSEKSLVKLCSIFSENLMQERGDLWQRRFIELVKLIVTSEKETFDRQKWETQANFLEKELKYFLLTLRFNFIKHSQNRHVAEHLLKSIDNFQQSILLMKSLNVVNMMVFFAAFFSESLALPLAAPDAIEHLKSYIQRLADTVKNCKLDMLCDYQQLSQELTASKKISWITSGITFSSCFGLLTYVEFLSTKDPQQRASSFFGLAKIGFSIASAALAYVRVQRETEHVSVDRLLDRVKLLALA